MEFSGLQSSCEVRKTVVRWGIIPQTLRAWVPFEMRIDVDKKGSLCQGKVLRPSQAPPLPRHYLIVAFREVMDLQRELVPNRRTQADTKIRKTAIAEMASATQSPIRPLRREKQPCS